MQIFVEFSMKISTTGKTIFFTRPNMGFYFISARDPLKNDDIFSEVVLKEGLEEDFRK